jgi:hypothetical protein
LGSTLHENFERGAWCIKLLNKAGDIREKEQMGTQDAEI